METSLAGFCVRATSLSILVLIFDQLLGRFFQSLIPMPRRQRQRIDQSIRGCSDLAQSDLRVFPPGSRLVWRARNKWLTCVTAKCLMMAS